MLGDACASENIVDIHTARGLTEILPMFVNGPPRFLPRRQSLVLTRLLQMKWTNGQLKKDTKAYKPDFVVYNVSGSVKHVVLISEVKAAERNSHMESDLVKLAKQMRLTMNGERCC